MGDYYDDTWEACGECGSTSFEANERDWERVCTNCGVTSAYELFNYVAVPKAYYYKHQNYFQNTILKNAINKGAPILNIQDELINMFQKSLDNFFRKQSMVGRTNYPSYNYALYQLCLVKGINILPYISLPKMKKTMLAVKQDWIEIDPSTNH